MSQFLQIPQLFGRVKASLVLCSVLALLPSTANALTVWSGADSGDGTLRQAVLDFPTSTDTEIVIQVATITLTSPTILYNNDAKKLVIRSTSNTAINVSGTNTAISCTSSKGAQWTGLEFHDAGVTITIPNDSQAGTVYVDLTSIDVWNSNGTGITIEDTLRGGGILQATLNDSQLISNGGLGCFIRKDGGTVGGDLVVFLTSVQAFLNGWDAVNIGGVDGIELNQFNKGGLYVSVSSCSLSDNTEDGIDIEENGDGNVSAIIDTVTCQYAREEGIEVVEGGNGDLTVSMSNCNVYDTRNTADLQRGGDAFEIQEKGAGRCDVTITNCQVLDGIGDPDTLAAAKDGIKIEPDGMGDTCVTIDTCTVIGCKDDGIDFEEGEPNQPPIGELYVGLSEVFITNSTVTQNLSHGIKASPATVVDPPHNTTGCSTPAKTAAQGDTGILDIQGELSKYQGNGPNPDENLEPDSAPWTRFGLATQL